ncbi:MAG: acyl-CoA dehydrogenase [Janthinobacterium lividum]
MLPALVPRPHDHVEEALATVRRLTGDVPLPGSGRTRDRWQVLARLGADDLTLARIAEAHLDAVAILAEAGTTADPGSTWGVFAAETGEVRLDAIETPRGWTLTGIKPWCSLAGRLSHCLVTAHTPAGRRLFAAGLLHPGVLVREDGWHARGLVDVPSGPVEFLDVAAVPVGEAGWYLQRPGFAHGGIGVAACWFGAAVAVARVTGRGTRPPDQLARFHQGALDLELTRARLAMDHAAIEVDAGRAEGAAGGILALRTRAIVAAAAEKVLEIVGHASGPAPLTFDAAHAARVADLTIYLRQHHAERDVAALGATLRDTATQSGGWPR